MSEAMGRRARRDDCGVTGSYVPEGVNAHGAFGASALLAAPSPGFPGRSQGRPCVPRRIRLELHLTRPTELIPAA